MLTDMTTIIGLSDVWDTVRSNWLGPLFLGAVAFFALVFIKDKAFLKLLGFIGIAAIVGLLIFGGDTLFGDGGNQDGALTGVADDFAQDIN